VPTAPLEDTRWRVASIGATAVPRATRPPFLLLAPSDGRHLLGGWSGCQAIRGHYDIVAGRLRLSLSPPTTPAACAEAPAALEAKLRKALQATANYRIRGTRLDLLSADGKVLARFTEAPKP